MIQKTIENIEAKIRKSGPVSDERRAELLRLLAKLKTEIGELSKTHPEQAESITAFAQASAHEATRKEKNPDLLKLSLDGLSISVKEIETSHPDLLRVVNAVSQALANMGI
jgi:queuine/archaeosine tRNA-ribosyltransferase